MAQIAEIHAEHAARLRNLEVYLAGHIRGQDQAVPRVVSVLHRGELGLSKPGRPKGSFLFLGPTGVGKTELTIAFTDYLLGKEKLFRFDMSEFQTQESLGLLLGARADERGMFGQVADRADSGTLLFDEIEKAHPRVLDIFLQILDAARITLATGETLDLSGFYVVFTSNVGSAELMGLQHSSFSTMERHVLAKAQQSLRPELFARVTEKLVFNRLSYDVQLEIARQMLDRELAFLRAKGIHLAASPDVLPLIVRCGFHPRLGARPLRDTVERILGDALRDFLLSYSESPHGLSLLLAPVTSSNGCHVIIKG